jgi:hypothetical protein
MKAKIMLLGICATAAVALAIDAPEFDRLKTNHQAAMERATKPLIQSYLLELEKQRDAYARAAKLDAANAVQAEINAVKQSMAVADQAKKIPPQAPVNPPPGTTIIPAGRPLDTRWFAGKTWLTNAKTKWNFGRNGVGDKMRGKDKTETFTWKVLDSGLLELTVQAGAQAPKTTEYIKFVSKTEAYFGKSQDDLNARLHYEGN